MRVAHYRKPTSDFYLTIPEASAEHEANVVRMICPHKTRSVVSVDFSLIHKFVQVNWNTGV